jgi:chromosome segregation ATPase
MENEITALRAELKAANARIEELTKARDGFEDELACAEERCNVKDAYIDELRMKLESVVSQNKKAIYTQSDTIHKLLGMIARLKSELTEVKERNENQFNTIQQLEKELKEYKVVVGDNPDAMKNYILETDERICKLRNDNKLLEMAMMDTDTNMSVISAENKRLREQIDKYDLVIHTIEQLFGCAFDI